MYIIDVPLVNAQMHGVIDRSHMQRLMGHVYFHMHPVAQNEEAAMVISVREACLRLISGEARHGGVKLLFRLEKPMTGGR